MKYVRLLCDVDNYGCKEDVIKISNVNASWLIKSGYAKEVAEMSDGEELTEMQKLRGTHIIMKRGDWLLLCGLSNITDSKATDDLIKKSERIIKQEYEKRLKDEARRESLKEVIDNIDKRIYDCESYIDSFDEDIEFTSRLRLLKGIKAGLEKELNP